MNRERLLFVGAFIGLIGGSMTEPGQQMPDDDVADDSGLDTGDPVQDMPSDGMDSSDTDVEVFSDPDSDFTTSDVHDVDNEIMRFSTSGDLIWTADGSTHSGWSVEDPFLETSQFFQVRFGTVAGERMAYFTETDTATICDLSVGFLGLSIRPTSMTVPQE